MDEVRTTPPAGPGGDAVATVRPAREADADALAALSVALGHAIEPAEAAARLPSPAEGAGRVVLVLERAGVVLGWVEARVVHALVAAPFAVVTGLVVAPEARCEGLGARLLAAAEAWAARRGLRRVRVRSNVVRERAHRFYARVGYREVKRQVILDRDLAPGAAEGAPAGRAGEMAGNGPETGPPAG